jgi:hypothetical protein
MRLAFRAMKKGDIMLSMFIRLHQLIWNEQSVTIFLLYI